jgi:hypothetical protein
LFVQVCETRSVGRATVLNDASVEIQTSDANHAFVTEGEDIRYRD